MPIQHLHAFNDIVIVGLACLLVAQIFRLLIVRDAHDVALADPASVGPSNLHRQVRLAQFQELPCVLEVRVAQVEGLGEGQHLLLEVLECVMGQNLHCLGHFVPHVRLE